MKGPALTRLAVCVLACLAAGSIGSIFTYGSVNTWFPTLAKPSFNPPGWVFGPVWTTLYILMGIAAGLVWNRGGLSDPTIRKALWLFALQLGLNTLWSALFFGLKSPFFALVDIVFLWAAILATTLAFKPVSAAAAWLMTPYLAWVSFAAILNAAIWKLNP